MKIIASLIVSWSVALLACCGACAADGNVASAGDPVRVLLITGQQNHDWNYTSKVHKETLEATGRFAVDITSTPATTLADAAAIKPYQVFFLDYNGARWGEPAEKNFLDAVSAGTGVVCVHAANNSFIGWTEYEKLVALVWIKETTGHGAFHSFDVTYTDTQHPITKGLANMKAHPDELYHKLVNTQNADYRLLATAFSDTQKGGTGQNEPMAIVRSYGKGRVFHTPLGHVWTGDEKTRPSINDPQFKILLARGTEWAGTGGVTLPAEWSPAWGQPATKPVAGEPHAQPNTLTDREKADGWTLLFDGTSTEHFRGFRQPGFPAKGWAASDGTLHVAGGGGGGDLVTKDQYEDFEFSIDWKISAGGNSGIIYLCSEEPTFNATYETGPEMQILDNKAHTDGKNTKTSCGALYDLIACSKDATKPVGEWNTFVIKKKGHHVEHWMNGEKVVEYEYRGEEFKKLVAASKWAKYPGFAKNERGHLALQDHGDDLWFRNIKIKGTPVKP